MEAAAEVCVPKKYEGQPTNLNNFRLCLGPVYVVVYRVHGRVYGKYTQPFTAVSPVYGPRTRLFTAVYTGRKKCRVHGLKT